MVLLTCANIFSRNVWVPIRGTFELMGYFGAVVTAFALGHTQLKKGHIAVDVLINTFSPRTKKILQVTNNGVCSVFFTVVAWQVTAKASTLMNTGEVTETLRIIYYPFTYAVALGCIVLALVMLADLIKSLIPKKERTS
jgi:TRAP-type C4-dicarboxylate transport system permease small subunit